MVLYNFRAIAIRHSLLPCAACLKSNPARIQQAGKANVVLQEVGSYKRPKQYQCTSDWSPGTPGWCTVWTWCPPSSGYPDTPPPLAWTVWTSGTPWWVVELDRVPGTGWSTTLTMSLFQTSWLDHGLNNRSSRFSIKLDWSELVSNYVGSDWSEELQVQAGVGAVWDVVPRLQVKIFYSYIL